MNSKLHHLAWSSILCAGAFAACGGSPTPTDQASDAADGDISIDGSSSGGGGSTDPRIVYTAPAQGFTNYDDGTGSPSYRSNEVTAEQAAVLTAALTSPPAADPSLIIAYPFDDTMVPRNLTFIEFQWKRAPGDVTFLVRATSGDKVYHLYLDAECTANNYCTRTLPKSEWLTLGRELAGLDVEFEIFGTSGSAVSRTTPVTVRYSPEDLAGALYYWASANATIKRASFGSGHAVDFIVPKTATTDYACVGCHSVSRDGSTIAFAVAPAEGENIAGIQTASTLDPTKKYINPTNGTTPFVDNAHGNTQGPTNSLGHNVALNPDGSRMAVNATSPPSNWPSHLDIRGTKTADTVLSSYEFGDPIFGGEKIGIMPEYSPDGTQLAVMLAEKTASLTGLSAWSAQKGGIGVLPANADGTLGTAKVIVTAPTDGGYHFYPTWSPDSKYLAFVTSWDQNGTSGSLGNDRGVLRMVAVADAPVTCPGPKCIELSRGTGYSVADARGTVETSGSTWPKFAPFAQGSDKSVYFITFTSRRRYGVRPIDQTQLWMFGVDTNRAGDPSFEPFWLPYQDTADGSLSPYWTETLPCNIDGGTCNGCLDSEACLVVQNTNQCTCAALTDGVR